MTRIEPYALWLGHAGEGREFKKIFDHGIMALVDVAIDETPTLPPHEMVHARFPLMDGAGNRSELLFLAISTLATLIKMGLPTLVVCSAGESRSPAIAAAALSLVYRNTPEECLKHVADQHPSDISPGLWKEVTATLSSAGR